MWNQYPTPDVYAKVKHLTSVSRHVEVRRCQLYEFEVELSGLHVGVKLDEGKCDCNAWCHGLNFCSGIFRPCGAKTPRA